MTERAAIYIELLPVGHSIEVAAIHSETGREVRFVVPAGTSEHDIKQLAQAKMAYVERKDAEHRAEEEAHSRPKDHRGGIIV